MSSVDQEQELPRSRRRKDHSEQERLRLDEEIRKRGERAESARQHVEERFCDDAVLTIEQFAALLGIHVLTLRRMIKNKKGPPLVRVNERHYGIVMRPGRKWIQSRAVEQE
jgi:hypothetical protein